MRLARLYLPDEASEVLGLEHDGSYYRVDRLDHVMGSPIPEDVAAADFSRRVLSLGTWTLEEHAAAIAGGMELSDTVASEFRTLPPTRVRPTVLELMDGGPPLPWRVTSSVYGSGDLVMTRCRGRLLAVPAVAVILGEDLSSAPPEEAHDAFLGISLAIAWLSEDDEQDAERFGLPRSIAREIGTHLGPTLNVMPPTPIEVLAGTRGMTTQVQFSLDAAQLAEAASRIAEHAELRAGDVLLSLSSTRLAPSEGEAVIVDAGALGRLVGTVGA